jgi:hypothetical protein
MDTRCPESGLIDESSALYKNFLVQVTALQLTTLAEEIILAHLHAANRVGARAKSETPKFQCRECWIYLRTTGDARTLATRIPPLLIAYRLVERGGQEFAIEPVLVNLLSCYEADDTDPLLPPEMLETLMDVVSATGEAPESLRLAVEQTLDEILGHGGN